MEKFKYINNITQAVSEIRLYKRIGSTRDEQGNYVDGVTGSDFANEMAYLATVTDKINVRINSGGGSVMDAMSIQASILNSKVPCDTYNDGIAASAAASILVCGRKSYMADNAIFMVHNGIDETGTINKKVMDVFNESIATLLSNRTGKSAEDITTMMSKETWMNAKQCIDNKIVDEVVPTGKKMKTPKVTNAFEMERIYNEFLTPKIQSMKNINNELNVTIENTDESLVVSAIKTIKAERDAFKIENDALKKEKNDAIEADKTALKTEVTNYAAKLVTDKKIKEDAKIVLIENASKDRASFEFIKNIYDGMSTVKPAMKIFNAMDVKGDERATWTYRDWETKDSKGLAKMQNDAPEQFTELYNAFYKK